MGKIIPSLQELLNHLMVLHVHKERADVLDLLNELKFVGDSDHRSSVISEVQVVKQLEYQ